MHLRHLKEAEKLWPDMTLQFQVGSVSDEILCARYDAYWAYNRTPFIPNARFSDEFDCLDNAINTSIFHKKQLIGGIRFHVLEYPKDKSPYDAILPSETTTINPTPQKQLVVSRLFLKKTFSREHPSGYWLPMRIVFGAASNYNIDRVLTPVKEQHASFYVRFLKFKILKTSIVGIPGLTKPQTLLAADFPSRKKASRIFQILFSANLEDQIIDFPNLANKQQNPIKIRNLPTKFDSQNAI